MRAPILAAALASSTIFAGCSRTDRPAREAAAQGTRYASVNGLRLAYESHGPDSAELILLIGGTGMQLTDWPPELVSELTRRGYRVVTFDNRDVGLSTHLDSLGLPDWQALSSAGEPGEPLPLPYSVADMADDAVGLLGALGVEAAHVVGVSQGGIIAQLIAIRHPERVLSLTPIMSGSGNPAHPLPADPKRLRDVSTPPASTETDSVVAFQIRVAHAFAGSGYPPDDSTLRARIERSTRRAYDPGGLQRQQAAALVATFQDRRQELTRVDVPTVVVQGQDDPLVPVESVREVARSIPNAELVLIPGMGHDLPVALTGRIADAITTAARRGASNAEGARRQGP
jgi:pimeloyl-ACP methyl ester carboxylesterase